jgi:hypothetical protein
VLLLARAGGESISGDGRDPVYGGVPVCRPGHPTITGTPFPFPGGIDKKKSSHGAPFRPSIRFFRGGEYFIEYGAPTKSAILFNGKRVTGHHSHILTPFFISVEHIFRRRNEQTDYIFTALPKILKRCPFF